MAINIFTIIVINISKYTGNPLISSIEELELIISDRLGNIKLVLLFVALTFVFVIFIDEELDPLIGTRDELSFK
jgi:hypothetical protein